MSLVSVYDALKAAGVADDKAVAAVRDLEDNQKDPRFDSFANRIERVETKIDQIGIRMDQLEKRTIRLEAGMAVLIALQIGQILLILRLLTG